MSKNIKSKYFLTALIGLPGPWQASEIPKKPIALTDFLSTAKARSVFVHTATGNLPGKTMLLGYMMRNQREVSD